MESPYIFFFFFTIICGLSVPNHLQVTDMLKRLTKLIKTVYRGNGLLTTRYLIKYQMDEVRRTESRRHKV